LVLSAVGPLIYRWHTKALNRTAMASGIAVAVFFNTWNALSYADYFQIKASVVEELIAGLSEELQRFVMEQKVCPASADDLQAFLKRSRLIDPYSSKSEELKMKQRGDTCVIYSIGPNLEDDSGAPLELRYDAHARRMASLFQPQSLHLALFDLIAPPRASGDIAVRVHLK
jgi:hypothetical protein